MRMFHSKHQKLILQCYPAGKAVDKKPNSSELSYLLYYASTRRIKLEKVASFLTRKTASDVGRNKAGNLQVTLAIISALIAKCPEDLNVFARYVCSILLNVLQTKDVSICKSALTTFGVFCKNLDNSLFPGDLEFVQQFSLLSETFISAQEKLSNWSNSASNPNQLEWQMISLVSCRHLAPCINLNAKFGQKFINQIIPLYLKTIHASSSAADLKRRSHYHNHHYQNSGSQQDGSLTKVISSKSAHQVNAKIDEDFENDSLTVEDINEEAFRGLKNLFNSSLNTQISEVTKVTIRSLHKGSGSRSALSPDSIRGEIEVDPAWGTRFIELVATWIPVQLRFITVTTLLAQLSELSDASNAATTSYDAQWQYANHVYGLVSSEINMIGLSISDINQHILELQSNLILYQSAFLDTEDITQLSQVYSDCICHLSTHIYYFDQVPDSIQEILTKIDSVLEYSYLEYDPAHGLRVPGEKIHELIITLLNDITTIFSDLKKKPSSITRNRVNLEHWDISLAILSPDTEFGGMVFQGSSGSFKDSRTSTSSNTSATTASATLSKKSSLSISHMNDTQRKYLKVFRDFLNEEFSESISTHSSTSPSGSISDDNETGIRKLVAPTKQHSFTLINKTKKKSNDYDYNDILKMEVRNYKKPDAQQYISISDNFLAHFLTYVDKFFSCNDYPNIENVFILTDILKIMINIFGINFINNFVPFFLHWLLPLKSVNGTVSIPEFQQKFKFKDTLALLLMYYCLKALDDIYSDNLDGYAGRSDFSSYLLYNIEFRQQNKLWMNGVDSHPTAEVIAGHLARVHDQSMVTPKMIKRAFQDLVSGNVFVSMWVNPEKALILDVIKRNLERATKLTTIQSMATSLHGAGNENGSANGFQDALEDVNGNGLAHGRFLQALSDPTSPDESGSEFTEGYSMRHTHNNGLGLGLGNANDISSIHSEIVHNRVHHGRSAGLFNQDYSNAGSIFTSEGKFVNTPKVNDLKELIRGDSIRRENGHSAKSQNGNAQTSSHENGNGFIGKPDFSFTSPSGETTEAPLSILSKQIVTTDVGSILGGLDSDDDDFVV